MGNNTTKVILSLALMAFAAAALTYGWGFAWAIACFVLMALILAS